MYFRCQTYFRVMRASPDCRREMRFTLTVDSSVMGGKTAEADLIRCHGAQLACYRRAVEEMVGDKVDDAVL